MDDNVCVRQMDIIGSFFFFHHTMLLASSFPAKYFFFKNGAVEPKLKCCIVNISVISLNFDRKG